MHLSRLSRSALPWFLTTAILPAPALSAPDPVPDPDATVIHLRSSCEIANADAGESPMENCFEKMSTLKQWLYGNSTPPRTDPAARVLVDIGPGDFTAFNCPIDPQTIDVEFRGAGADRTTLNNIFIYDCPAVRLTFRDLTIRNPFGNGVQWIGAGESLWYNVVIEGTLNAWYDKKDPTSDASAICQAGESGTHRFFSTRLISRGNATDESAVFLSWCGDNWFWGSELLFEGAAGATVARGVSLKGPASRLHLYGSNIRVESGLSTEASGEVTGIRATDDSEVHVHGTGIDVVGRAGWTMTALEGASGAHIHANESSYVMLPASGATLRRIVSNGANISAPFQWRQAATPPAVQSEDGADTVVVTSGTSDNHPHLLVSDNTCGSGWYDTSDKACHP